MKQQQSITNLPQSPDAERHGRMIKYSIMMGIRVVCLVAVLFIPGWWKVIPAAGAIFLPYFAVVIANVGNNTSRSEVLRPGAIVPVDENGRASDRSDDVRPEGVRPEDNRSEDNRSEDNRSEDNRSDDDDQAPGGDG